MNNHRLKSGMISKIYIQFIFITVLMASFTSCEDKAVYTPDERFVLQAYLYANEPVWDITIKNAVPLTVADSIGEPINDAIVTLFKNNIAYSLVTSSDTGTYSYPGNDLSIETDDNFYIEAEVDGKIASGETSVPENPEGVMMSQEIIELPEIDLNEGSNFEMMRVLRDSMNAISIEVIWDNSDNKLHFVVIENAEENQESIMPTINGNFGMARGRGSFRLVKRPTRESSQEINMSEIEYWGKYIVKVFRVNQEYADLYENLSQDSRDLNEPPTNITGGLGIFSAFNSQDVYFEVTKL